MRTGSEFSVHRGRPEVAGSRSERRVTHLGPWRQPDNGSLNGYNGGSISRSPGFVVSSERVERRLVAILAADVASYSRLMGRDEEGTLAQLKSFRKALVDPAITVHRGHIVKTTGDGML